MRPYRHQREYSDAERALMRRAHDNGESISSIARSMGVSWQTAARLLGGTCLEHVKRQKRNAKTVDCRDARRDPPPYEFVCPECGMGVDLKGHRFETAADAMKCCEGIAPAAGYVNKGPRRKPGGAK